MHYQEHIPSTSTCLTSKGKTGTKQRQDHDMTGGTKQEQYGDKSYLVSYFGGLEADWIEVES